MKKRFLALAIVAALSLTLLSGCGESKPTLKVFNWGEFIAQDVIADFEEEFDCRVIYETYDSNEAMLAKVSNSGTSGYDVVFPSDYMVAKMIELDLLHELDFESMPNTQNLNPSYMSLAHDPNNQYSVPYMFGTLGILYNTDMISEPIDSIGALFDDKYAGQVFMLKGMRDTIGMTLTYLGYSQNTENPQEIEEAKNLLIEQKPNVLAYVTDDVLNKMVGGEGALALVFTGEGNKAVEESDNLEIVIPKEGSNLAVDTMVILKDSQNVELAHKFIDFMCREGIALRNAEETGYSSPNLAAVEQLDPAIANNPSYYPPKEILDKCEIFLNLSEEGEKLWSSAWTQVLSD